MSLSKQTRTITDLTNAFKSNNFSYSWHTIQVGWELGLIDANDVSAFALQYAENNPDDINMYISEVIFGVSNNTIHYYLSKIFEGLNIMQSKKGYSIWNLEWRKWRYYMLQKKIENATHDEEILIKTEEVYADFSYPEDMRSLIYYLSSGESQPDNPLHARKKLIDKIYMFLKTEKSKILAGKDTLPHMYEPS